MATYTLEEVVNGGGKKTYRLDEVVPKQPGFGEKLNAEISNIPRQGGLTVRNIAEGVADTVGIFSDPLAATYNIGIDAAKTAGFDTPEKLTSARGAVSSVLDAAGVPTPNTPTERVVGSASRTLAGVAPMLKGADVAAKVATGTTQKVLQSMAQAPDYQAAGAVGAGAAGEYTKETGGNGSSQFAASIGGGLLAPTLLAGAKSLPSVVSSVKNFFTSGNQPVNVNVDVVIQNALKNSGLTLDDLAGDVKARLRDDVSKAMNADVPLDPASLNRLISYRLIGATPARGNLTLDPVDVTRLQNLSRIGANSQDPALQQLAQRQNQNTGILVNNLDNLGANTADDSYSAGQKVISALGSRIASKQADIGAKYDAARASTGRYADMDRVGFVQSVNDRLDQAMIGGKLPGDVRNQINAIAKGDVPFNVNYVEQLKTRIGDLQRATSDRSERMALGLVRSALDDTAIASGQGEAAVGAFNAARRANRNWRNIVESTPALKAVEDGIEPDKFVSQFIIGNGSKASVMDVAALKSSVKKSPEAMNAVKEQIVSHLKQKAVGQSQGQNFSQAAYNKALSDIGERKLKLFFTKEEIARLKAVGDVAFAEQVQPSGSAVNNSNSGALALAGMLDMVGNSPLLRKIPFGAELVGNPIKNVAQSVMARNAMQIPGALVPAKQSAPIAPMLFLPSMGLLSQDR